MRSASSSCCLLCACCYLSARLGLLHLKHGLRCPKASSSSEVLGISCLLCPLGKTCWGLPAEGVHWAWPLCQLTGSWAACHIWVCNGWSVLCGTKGDLVSDQCTILPLVCSQEQRVSASTLSCTTRLGGGSL